MDALGQHRRATGQESGGKFGRGNAEIGKQRTDHRDGRFALLPFGRHACALPYSSVGVRRATASSLLNDGRRGTQEGSARGFQLAAVSKSRLEAFSDGVLAILITIMVLELR